MASRAISQIHSLTLLFGASCAQPNETVVPEEATVASTAKAMVETVSAEPMDLPAGPKTALAKLKEASKDHPIAVFKHSPICPISAAADERFKTWMGEEDASNVEHAHIDVIGEKPLARGLVAELGIKHESPQVLLFHNGEVVWHASHGNITGEALSEQLALIE